MAALTPLYSTDPLPPLRSGGSTCPTGPATRSVAIVLRGFVVAGVLGLAILALGCAARPTALDATGARGVSAPIRVAALRAASPGPMAETTALASAN